MRNPEFEPKFELKMKERRIEEKPNLPEIKEETIQKLKEAIEVLRTTSSKKIRRSEYRKYYRRLRRHKKEWGYINWDDFLAKEGLRISKREETIQKLKEAVKELGTSSEEIQRSKYCKYYERLRKHKTEWAYKDWDDFLVKQGLRIPFKEETLKKLEEAVTVLGTSSKKIKESKYGKYFLRLQRHRKEWDYKDWSDFLEKEGINIAKNAWNELLEKYKYPVTRAHIDIGAFVEHFFERKYTEAKPKYEKRVVKLLKAWREEKVLKSQEK